MTDDSRASTGALCSGCTISAGESPSVGEREALIDPSVRVLDHSPKSVLWVPDGTLRLLPPNALWRDTPVATATSLDLVDPYHFLGRHRSTLVGLADPGDLKDHGRWTLEQLAREAANQGHIRIVASTGVRFDRPLIEHPDVRDTPASVRHLLAEAQEHRTIVLIAHGMVPSPVDAALVCVDPDGNEELLDVDTLAVHPSAFASAQVILLSCSSGAVGAGLADPGGPAGTIIGAGARWVVAPPVADQRQYRGRGRSRVPWRIGAR